MKMGTGLPAQPGTAIFTGGEILEDLLENIEEAVRLYFEDEGGAGG